MLLSAEELSELRKLAEAGSAHQPLLKVAATPGAYGSVESDHRGGVRITAEGRKHLRDVAHGLA